MKPGYHNCISYKKTSLELVQLKIENFKMEIGITEKRKEKPTIVVHDSRNTTIQLDM